MAHSIMSKKKAHALATIVFFLGLAILALTKTWWPPILLVVGVPIALKQYLLGRRYDMSMTLLVFLGAYITIEFNLHLDIVLPVLFTIGAIHIFIREFWGRKESEVEKEENFNKEIEEESNTEEDEEEEEDQ